jgi:hypothetical protein
MVENDHMRCCRPARQMKMKGGTKQPEKMYPSLRLLLGTVQIHTIYVGKIFDARVATFFGPTTHTNTFIQSSQAMELLLTNRVKVIAEEE